MPSTATRARARAVEDVGDRLHVHQHVALLGALSAKSGAWIRKAWPPSLFGHLRSRRG